MNDFFDDKRLVGACIIGIVVVLTVSLISIIFVWQTNLSGVSNNSNNEVTSDIEVPSDIGTFKMVNISREEQLKRYTLDLTKKIESGNIDDIYELLDSGYIDYFDITKESIKAKLEGKGILGKKLDISSYNYTSFNNMNIYALKYSTADNSITGTINIMEISPNNYKIAFDDFVDYDSEPKEIIQDGFKFTIYDQVWFNSRYKLKAKFKNLNENSYIVNSSRLYENNYLRLTNEVEVRTMSTVLAGDVITLDKNGEMNYTLEFSISELSFSTIKSFVIKGIKSVDTGVSKDYEFEI